MFRFFVILILTFNSLPSFASWSGAIRTEYENIQTGEVIAGREKGNSQVDNSYAVINFESPLGENSVTGQFDLLCGGADYNRDCFVVWLYTDLKLNDSLSLQWGKIQTAVGGYEGAAMEEGDDYQGSLGNGSDTSLTGNITATFANNPGVGITWSNDAQTVTFQVLNGDVGGAGTSKRNSYGINYEAGLGIYGAQAGYFVAPALDPNNSSDSKVTLMNLGFSGDWGSTKGWFDYFVNSQKVGTGEIDTTTSLVATIKHELGNGMIPLFKYESSSLESKSSSEKGARTGLVFGFEYKGQDTDEIRYHVLYKSLSEKAEGLAEVKEAAILAGLKYSADFLK